MLLTKKIRTVYTYRTLELIAFRTALCTIYVISDGGRTVCGSEYHSKKILFIWQNLVNYHWLVENPL